MAERCINLLKSTISASSINIFRKYEKKFNLIDDLLCKKLMLDIWGKVIKYGTVSIVYQNKHKSVRWGIYGQINTWYTIKIF